MVVAGDACVRREESCVSNKVSGLSLSAEASKVPVNSITDLCGDVTEVLRISTEASGGLILGIDS